MTTEQNALPVIDRILELRRCPLVESNGTQGWAQDLVATGFPTVAADGVREVEEAIDADASLAVARNARMEAYAPARDAFLSFKRVVRTACGSKSREYHRIHVRSAESAEPVEPRVPSPAPQVPEPVPSPA